MSDWPFAPLKMFGYDLIVADPPWAFRLYSGKGEAKSAAHHYATMEMSDIASLPVGHLACGDCVLFLWACGCMLPQAIGVMQAWGFVFKSEIIWRKVHKSGAPRMGTGYRVRTLHEPILVGTIGNPQHKALPSLFTGVARQHSRKPEEFYELIEKSSPNALRAELFSRQNRPGWDHWGDEAGKFDG